ncbi:DUF6518 family protein [Aquipuribacter hungaricus]|uniref:DUF6518 family protein n=1 Tax=Aquipuribacter hungaricus TaxID=545624 RepID=A0ABV7WIK8_9MICO
MQPAPPPTPARALAPAGSPAPHLEPAGAGEQHPAATDTPAPDRPWARTTVPVLVALLLGALTAFGQAHLPETLTPLANSSGSWTVVAFACALLPRSARTAALVGALAMLAMLAGYVVTNELRGFPSSSALLLFWGVLSVTVGPPAGLGAYWARTRRDLRAALGLGALAGILVGEAAYGLTVVSESTPAAYWWGSVLVGVAVTAWASVRRLRGAAAQVAAPVVAAAVATPFVGLYTYGGTVMGLL